jgi:Fe-S cluster assembly protein SufD
MSAVRVEEQVASEVGGWVKAALVEAERRQSALKLDKGLVESIKQARQVWEKLRFPTPQLESWKYTNPEAIAQGGFELTVSVDEKTASELLQHAAIPGLGEAVRLVYVDGRFSEKLSKIEKLSGVTVDRLASGVTDGAGVASSGVHREEAFSALSTALITDAVCISTDRGVAVAKPIHIVHIATEASKDCVTTPRTLIQAAESSSVTVVESHIGRAGIKYLALPVSEVRADQNAKVDYYKIQIESRDAYHVSTVVAEQGRDAEIRTHVFSFGSILARNNMQVLLKGSNGQALLNGLSLLDGKQHVDNATLIHHIEPSAESREHFKGVYAGESRGVFSGTITVEKVAQKTNAFQSNQALLLSPHSSIESRPQLKIWADDVKCTHGATVGQLDEEALFYLRSRGIGAQEAKAFLVHAFASEVLTSVQSAPVKEYVESVVSARLVEIHAGAANSQE